MDYQKITYDILAALIEQDKEFFLQNSHFSDSCKDAFIASIDKDISTKTVMVCDLEFVAGFDVTDYKKRMFGSRAKRASATCRVNVHWIVDGVSSPLPGVQEPRDGYSK